jgi:MFS family permease
MAFEAQQDNVIEVEGDAGVLHCYRHPDRETYVRCGRCDQPICPKCAMQGPVGFRCRTCGTLKNDPITSFSPGQLVAGLATSIAAGAIASLISGQIGFYGIFIGFFAGGFVAEIVARTIGYKRGPVMLGILAAGIVAGTVLGTVADTYFLFGSIPEAEGLPMTEYLWFSLRYSLLFAAAMIAGAWTRVR